MLVIERALQVFGELIQNEGVTNCPVKHYLCSCLEQGAESKIMWIRNCLSHYDTNYIQGQLYVENNEDICSKLQDEFKRLGEIFDKIEITHLSKIQDIMIQKALDEAKISFKEAVPYLEEEKVKFFLIQKEAYCKNEVNFLLLLENMLNYIANGLDKLKNSPLSNDKITKAVKSQVTALIYLLEYMIRFGKDHVNTLQSNMESFKNFISQVNECDSIYQHDAALLPLLKECSDNVKNLIQNDQKLRMSDTSLISKELGDKYQKHDIFNSRERYNIRRSISKYLEKSKKAKEFCLNNIEAGDINVLKKKLSIIVTTKEKKLVIGNFLDNNSKRRAKKCLEKIEVLTLDSIFKPNQHTTTDTILAMTTDDQRFLLMQLKFKGLLKRKVRQLVNQRIFFLINRITKLKEVLIKDDPLIYHLWKCKKNDNLRKHIKGLICQRYLLKFETRAAAEMLIMDCMGIFGDKKNKELWIKTNNLFSGVNLRDILSHGNPLIQRVSNILDPKDFVFALIDHIIELIEDKKILFSLSNLWFTQKLSNLTDFIESIDGENGNEVLTNCSERDLLLQKLKRQVKTTGRWKKYVKLLPLKDKF